jgi:hypothetical protein
MPSLGTEFLVKGQCSAKTKGTPHAFSDSNAISKPWKNIKSTRAVFSYWIVYFIIFLGIARGAFQCYWTFTHVPLEKQPMCIVLDENFDNEDAAPDGSTTNSTPQPQRQQPQQEQLALSFSSYVRV